MFSFTKTTCYAKYFFTKIKRNGSKNTNFINFSALSSKNEQRWKNGTLLQLNKYQSTIEKNELQKFMTVFPEIVKDLTDPENDDALPDVSKWFSEVLQYNVPHSKKASPLILLLSYRMMAKPEDQTAENIHLAMILGWCIEMFHAGYLISDDVMDGSETRQGVQCWYKKNEVGLSAINDSSLLKRGMYVLLRKYFHDQPNYVDILEIFQDMNLKTAIGQSLDSWTAQHKLEFFTLERYKSITKYKSAIFLLILPVKLAMCLAGCPSEMKHAETCLIDLGYLCQIENDFVDCYGDPAVTGKVGTDIQEGKCTWLAVTALQKASPEQRKIMKECYGLPDPQKVAAIKNLYKDLNMPNEFAVFRNKFTNDIQFKIQNISNEKVHNLMPKICERYWSQLQLHKYESF